MCVLTYIPKAKNGFIFTSNRDESVAREPAIPPRKYEINGNYVFFPKDPLGGGTWIGGCEAFTLCLLNGGFEKHIPNPPYRHSRGKAILDFYKYPDTETFVNQYNFDNLEPFTLVIIDRRSNLSIKEIRWTGKKIFLQKIDPSKPKIWSSVTLYSPQIIQEREHWFSDFLQEKPNCNSDDILSFHHNGGKGDIQNDIKMNRENKLMTLSVTQFIIDEEHFLVRYEDLQINKKFVYRVFTECIS